MNNTCKNQMKNTCKTVVAAAIATAAFAGNS